MKVTRRSPFTGKLNTMEIEVHPEEIAAWANGVPIQKAMARLTPDEREFIKTGLTPEDWEALHLDEE